MGAIPTDLHALARAGDLAAREEIVHANLGLVRKIARRYRHLIEADDAFQVGVLGLLHAIETFVPGEHPDVRFGTYAAYRIRHHLVAAVREPAAPLLQVDPADGGPGPAATLEASERSGLIRSAFAALSPAQAEVISALEGLEGPPESIAHLARRMRCSRFMILTVRAAGVAALRAALRVDVAPE